MTADPLTALLDTITELELDDDVDTFPWTDAARWSPGVALEALEADEPLQFADDGCVMVCDPLRPWVVLEYQPPWWARD